MKGDTVVALKEAHPDFTLQQIAERTGMTKEGARWHLKREGMPTRRVRRRCARCGGWIYRKDKKFCTSRCREEFRKGVVLTCDWCGKRFTKGKWDAKGKEKKGYKHRFCSKECFYNFLRR